MSWSTVWVKEKRKCEVEDCKLVHYARGWCRLHYNRMLHHGKLTRFKDGRLRANCKIENCLNVASIVGYCKKHYDKQRHIDKPISAKANHQHHIKYRYGITIDEYNDKLEIQNNACAICRKPETRVLHNKVVRLAVDHCHKTEKVRELLCRRCNAVLGSVDDNIDLLKEMISYLDKHKVKLICQQQ